MMQRCIRAPVCSSNLTASLKPLKSMSRFSSTLLLLNRKAGEFPLKSSLASPSAPAAPDEHPLLHLDALPVHAGSRICAHDDRPILSFQHSACFGLV